MQLTDHPLPLICHPATPTQEVLAVEVLVTCGADGHLALTYRVDGDVTHLVIPTPQVSGPADDLWKHTCFEAFVAVDETAYYEFNFAPSGQWAAYAFSNYRQQDEAVTSILIAANSPRIAVRKFANRLEVDATII